MRDEDYHRHKGTRRYFWLIDAGVQLIYEPFGWTREWYVDLVDVSVQQSQGETIYHVQDRYIDLVVEGMGPTYRIIDLDEFGRALEGGAISQQEAASILSKTQQFVDGYLNRGAPFPPPLIQPFFAENHRYPPLQ